LGEQKKILQTSVVDPDPDPGRQKLPIKIKISFFEVLGVLF
jgi:hypothetical protein